MSKISINTISDKTDPIKELENAAVALSDLRHISLSEAQKEIATSLKIPSWFELNKQVEATAYLRQLSRLLFSQLEGAKTCIRISGFHIGNLSDSSRNLLKMSLNDCMNLPKHTLEHLLDIVDFDNALEENNTNKHHFYQVIKSWDNYVNIRARDDINEQLCEFVKFKIRTQSFTSKGDLVDRSTGMHMYVRCQTDGTALKLDEFWCQKSLRASLADHENFVAQSFHVIEDSVLSLLAKKLTQDIELEFRTTNSILFYQEVFMHSKLKMLTHTQKSYHVHNKGNTPQYLTIRITI